MASVGGHQAAAASLAGLCLATSPGSPALLARQLSIKWSAPALAGSQYEVSCRKEREPS